MHQFDFVKFVAAENRFWIAMAIYAALALIAWQTLTAVIDVQGRPVPLVWIVWLILAMFAARTYLFDLRKRQESAAMKRIGRGEKD